MGPQNRDRSEILYEIMAACKKGTATRPAIVSYISKVTRISHYVAVEHIQILGEAGMIDSHIWYNSKIENLEISKGQKIEFKVNKKGNDYMEIFEEQKKLLEKVREFDHRKPSA